MPALRVARIAAAGSIAAALAVIAAAALEAAALTIAAAVLSIVASVIVLRSLSSANHDAGAAVAVASTPQPSVIAETPRPPRKRAEPTATLLVAGLRNVSAGSERLVADLNRILVGIVADERGSVDRTDPASLVASFPRADGAAAAVDAARRMLSNVDAVCRRLGHDFRIAIAVHVGPKGEETLEMASRIRDAATDSVPVLVSAAVAAGLGDQLERVETLSGDGWEVDVFTFPPAQKRLPGF